MIVHRLLVILLLIESIHVVSVDYQQTANVSVGDDVELLCNSTLSDFSFAEWRKYSSIWRHETIVIPGKVYDAFKGRYSSTTSAAGNFNLKIARAELNDTGSYRCLCGRACQYRLNVLVENKEKTELVTTSGGATPTERARTTPLVSGTVSLGEKAVIIVVIIAFGLSIIISCCRRKILKLLSNNHIRCEESNHLIGGDPTPEIIGPDGTRDDVSLLDVSVPENIEQVNHLSSDDTGDDVFGTLGDPVPAIIEQARRISRDDTRDDVFVLDDSVPDNTEHMHLISPDDTRDDVFGYSVPESIVLVHRDSPEDTRDFVQGDSVPDSMEHEHHVSPDDTRDDDFGDSVPDSMEHVNHISPDDTPGDVFGDSVPDSMEHEHHVSPDDSRGDNFDDSMPDNIEHMNHVSPDDTRDDVFGAMPVEMLEAILNKLLVFTIAMSVRNFVSILEAESAAYGQAARVSYAWWKTIAGWPESDTKHWLKHQLRRRIQCYCGLYTRRPALLCELSTSALKDQPSADEPKLTEGEVWGVTVLADVTYAIISFSNAVAVFDKHGRRQDDIIIEALTNPQDIVACGDSGTIYIADQRESQPGCVWCMTAVDGKSAEWLVVANPRSLSLRAGRLLVTAADGIAHYDSEQNEIRRVQVQLNEAMRESVPMGLSHAVETAGGSFVVCGLATYGECRVVSEIREIDANGAHLRAYRSARLSSVRHLALDREGGVIAADLENKCMILLGSRLAFRRTMLSERECAALAGPMRLCFTEDGRRLIVADSDNIRFYEILAQ